jgi:hypothetical protein
VVLPFDLKTHDSKPGLLAYVPTVIKADHEECNTLRTSNRYEEIRVTDLENCPCCGHEIDGSKPTPLQR